MRAFRVAKQQYPAFDPSGAFLHGARWNSPGKSVIYAAQSYAACLMEILVHTHLNAIPKNHVVVTITIPEEVSSETADLSTTKGWQADDSVTARAFGDRWIAELRSAVLLVPSVVLQGRESNVIINPAHAEFSRITASKPEPVIWESRLFSRSG